VIARLLPAGAACQILRVADRTGCASYEVTAGVANAVSKECDLPKRSNDPKLQADARSHDTAREMARAGSLAQESFPGSPITHTGPGTLTQPAAVQATPGLPHVMGAPGPS